MSAERAILHTEEVDVPVSDWELDNAVAYVKANCKTESDEPMEIDKAFLAVLFNTARETRASDVILPLHVARTVSSVIRQKNKAEKPRYEGYKRGAMKIFADRSARSEVAQEKKRASLAETRRTGKKKKHAHPVNEKGQYILL